MSKVTPAVIFISLRSATILGTILLAREAAREFHDSWEIGKGMGIAAITFGGGLIVCGVITLIDWSLVPSSVRKYNERLQIKPEIDLKEKRYGIGFVYRF